MTNRAFFFLALLIGVIGLCNPVGASIPYEDYSKTVPQFKHSTGTLIIYVEKDGAWKHQGKLALDKYYREKGIKLNSEDISGDKVRIKLIQNGGGGVYIDAASLGGAPITELYPESSDGLAMVRARDFNVLHGFDKTIELEFDKTSLSE